MGSESGVKKERENLVNGKWPCLICGGGVTVWCGVGYHHYYRVLVVFVCRIDSLIHTINHYHHHHWHPSSSRGGSILGCGIYSSRPKDCAGDLGLDDNNGDDGDE